MILILLGVMVLTDGRTIVSKSFVEACIKFHQYVESFPPELYGTRVVLEDSGWLGGVYRIVFDRADAPRNVALSVHWKGKSGYQVFLEGAVWVVREFFKDKDSGDVSVVDNVVPSFNVSLLYGDLRAICDVGGRCSYRDVVGRLIFSRGLDVDIEAFNGGKNRASFYFPLYYYPLKVLEWKGLIVYHGRGGVTLLDGSGKDGLLGGGFF